MSAKHEQAMADYEFKPKRGPDDYGWHQRGYLPHFDGPGYAQFVTFRLCDSMPQTLLDKWRSETTTDAEFRKRIEVYLDKGMGECWLREPVIAALVRDALKFHDGSKYRLGPWVIMPNHAHAALTPLEGNHLPDVLHSIKSFTANKANEFLGRRGPFWQRESFDRYIRNEKHYLSVVKYIENNPVKAGLCAKPEDWVFSSAHERLVDSL